MVERIKLTQVLGVENKYQRKTLTEEHTSIVTEPGSSYFSHTTPQSGFSKDTTESLVVSLKSFEHPLQWLAHVCLLHANELPLRHLFEALDGATTGPSGFSGSIGKRLVTCSLRRVMKARAAHNSGQLRRFKVPAKLNFDAVEYFDMIDWAIICPISEPPALKLPITSNTA